MYGEYQAWHVLYDSLPPPIAHRPSPPHPLSAPAGTDAASERSAELVVAIEGIKVIDSDSGKVAMVRTVDGNFNIACRPSFTHL